MQSIWLMGPIAWGAPSETPQSTVRIQTAPVENDWKTGAHQSTCSNTADSQPPEQWAECACPYQTWDDTKKPAHKPDGSSKQPKTPHTPPKKILAFVSNLTGERNKTWLKNHIIKNK
jgi:hypothetical protein